MKEEDTVDEETQKAQVESLTETFKKSLSLEKLEIKLENLKSEDVAGMIVLSEQSRRMQDMMKMYGGGMDASMFPSDEVLVLNRKHPLVKYTLENGDKDQEVTDLVTQQLYDLAMISHKPLSPDAMNAFIKRSNEILKRVVL